jgi:hypothetical protein
MKKFPNFKKPLLPLLRSTSNPKISAFGAKKNKNPNQIDENSSEDDREEVQKLSEWEKQESKLDFLTTINEAKSRLNKRITGQDLVEELIIKRKHKNKLPSIKSFKIISLADTTKHRQQKKETEESFKERCRYFRIFEEDLNDNYNKLILSLNDSKRNRNNLREQCCEIKRKVTIVIEEYEKLKEEYQNVENKGRLKTQEELFAWIIKKKDLKERLDAKELEKISVTQEVQAQVNEISKELNKSDEVCKDLRNKAMIVRKAQTKHFLGLLKEGKDTKSEGLQWIVISLWKLGQTVSLEDFPSFLDEDSIHCILFVSQKNLEADEILENIINPARKSTTLDKTLDKSISLKDRISKLTKNLKVQKPEYIYDKKTKQFIIKWVPLDSYYQSDTSERAFSEVNQYESYISKIKEVVLLTKESEIRRLSLEFQLHHYQERYKVTLKDLINAIVGLESSEKYLAMIAKEQKQLSERIESTRTFNFTSRLI